MTDAEMLAEFEELRKEFGTGEGLPDWTPEGQLLWDIQHCPDCDLSKPELCAIHRRE